MSEMNEQYNHGRLYDNLDRLLKLGEPAPIMPQDLKARIRSELIEMEPESCRRNIFSGRWAAWPLAAATVSAVLFIVFWPGGSPNTISWADVQKHFDQIRVMTFRGYIELTTPAGKRITNRYKTYYKDPGLSRGEQYAPDADLDTAEPETITILKRVNGLVEQLTLHPNSHRAEWGTMILRINNSEPPSQPKYLDTTSHLFNDLDLASRNWELLKGITADKTKRIGNMVIGGMPAVGFAFEVHREFIPADAAGDGRGKIWACRDDGVPILIEVEYRNVQGQNVRMEFSDIQWNVPLDESLFNLAVPTGWDLNRARTELIQYTGTDLAPGVTLEISPDGQQPLTAAGDVAGVIQVIQTTDAGSNIPETMQITIDLKPAAAQRLHDYADAHPDKIFIANFNGQRNVAVKLEASHPTQISINLNWLRISLAELETKYFTTAIEGNKK